LSSPVIKIENLSKRYRLGLVGSGTLKDDLKGWWYRARGKEDPTLKIGDENRLDTASGNYVWALRDINLEVDQGEVLGIIGKNGAGKSTLLKILSRVTGPTGGIVKTRGRIASLLEVGTGMHPELTGRENVFLNGAILGMSRYEIRSKFDAIVDFAGVAKYIDTPVKRYSSGMHVRLGFAVAAFLEPEILIVDEVLAVGDAEFQKKAIGKMQDVSKGEGRTVLFVSHNMASISKLCSKCTVLEQGKVKFIGSTNNALEVYTSVGGKVMGHSDCVREDLENSKFVIHSISLLDKDRNQKDQFMRGEQIFVELEYEVLKEGTGYNPGFEVWSRRYDCIFTSKFWDMEIRKMEETVWETGKYKSIIKLPSEIFKGGSYFVTAAAAIPLKEMLDEFPQEVGFRVEDISSPIFVTGEERNGFINPELEWNNSRIS
jgi:lipopolysaccharide transport system ATP-binding protein